MGNILDIKSKRKEEKQKRSKSPKEEKSYQVFVPDIDNFVGVKEIKNFCIASLIDNGYGNGQRSEGVLQVYNKIDGHPIDKEDIARVQSVAKFLGALAKKAL